MAIEKGLEPLADILFAQGAANVSGEAAKYINEQVKDEADALQGARDIVAERIAESESARTLVRSLFAESASVASRVLTTKKRKKKHRNTAIILNLKSPYPNVLRIASWRSAVGRRKAI